MAKKPVSLEATMRGEPQPETPTVSLAPAVIKAPASEKLTVYVPKAAAKRLKQMALDHDRRVNDFLQEGVDLMLAKYGQPSLTDFGEK
jgi:hypothetical protein